MIYSIYKIENNLNKKCYIGFTSQNPNERFKQHMKAIKRGKLSSAVKKHGKENFIIETLYQSLDGDHTLNVMEPYFISQHNPEYNLTSGGEGILGYKHTDLTKENLRKMKLGTTWSEDQKQCIRGRIPWNKGKKHSKETLAKISEKVKGENGFWYGKKRPEHSTKLKNTKRPDVSERLKINHHNLKLRNTYKILLENGKEIIFTGLNKFCKENGYSTSSVRNVLLKKTKKHKNIVFAEILKHGCK